MVDAPRRWCCQEVEQVCWIWGCRLGKLMGFQEASLENETGAYLEKEESKNGAQRCIRELLVLLCQVCRQGPDGFSSVVVQLRGESRPVKSRHTQRMGLKKAMAYGR